MQSLDIEFEYNQPEEGYLYRPEENLENEIVQYIENSQNDCNKIKLGAIEKEAFLQLTPLRHRLLSWYSFEKNSSILEIGAGFGALTGLLCEKADEVIAIELKSSRAQILKKRFENVRNLTVLCGNLMDIHFRQQFQYIIVHDIFALVRKYLKAENPNVAFLKYLHGMLTKDGVILLAVENRLGLKYFAGASEEYTREFYAGLNTYAADERNRTMSKGELKDICKEAGFKSVKYFYPYPNHVIPQEIYTDEILKSIYYGGLYEDLELLSDRFSFFDEKRMFRTMQREAIVTNFANSFLIELAENDPISTQAAYIRFEDNFKVFQEHNQLFYVNECGITRKYPNGQRLDGYLADLVEKIVNCNLGTQNPYLAEVYKLFQQMSFILGTEKRLQFVSDFYLCDGIIHLLQRNIAQQPYDLNFIRWWLVYDWYRRNIMHYRNAERRIQLSKLYKILEIHIDENLIETYVTKWEKYDFSVKSIYEPQFFSDFIFDFDAAGRGDNTVFDPIQLYTPKQKVAQNLLELHSFIKEVKN